MATVDGRPTLLDYAMLEDPDGKPAQVLEVLNSQMPMLQDAPAYPSNAPMGNRTLVRKALPSVSLGRINKGTKKSKTSYDARQDTIGFLDGRSEVDARTKKVVGEAAFRNERWLQDKGFLEAFGQKGTDLALYGNHATNEDSFDGFIPRMNTLNDDADNTASQVHSAGSVTNSDGCSLLVVDWGEEGASLIFPPNTVGGVQVEDLGRESVSDAAGDPFDAEVTSYLWFLGLAVRDTRHIGRLCNIDLSDATGVDIFKASPTYPSQGGLIPKVMRLLDCMPEPGGLNRVIYVPKKLYTGLRTQAMSQPNMFLSMQQYMGRPTVTLDGYPVKREWRMSVAEGTVS